MTISATGFTPLLPSLQATSLNTSVPALMSQSPADPQPGFMERLGDALNGVARAQNTAQASATAYELGETQDLASVMIDQQVASLGFQLSLNVRNKALTAYRDIMNMPV